MHQVKLVINAREDLCDGGGVGDHTAGAHDFGQISARYHSGWPQLKICASPVAYEDISKWLVVDSALEASWTPVHKLNGTLGLDSGHGRIHIFGHHISLQLVVNQNMKLRPLSPPRQLFDFQFFQILHHTIVSALFSHQVSTIHHAASHVLAVAGIALHHHGSWLEDRHCDLCHGQLLMVRLLCRDNRSIWGQHEVDARIGHQIRLEPWQLMCI